MKKINSIEEVEEIVRSSTKENLLECLDLQNYAKELDSVESIKKVYDYIGNLAEKLENDEDKIKVLAGFDEKNIKILYDDDERGSWDADPMDRVAGFSQNSFDFLRKIVNSIENNIEFKRYKEEYSWKHNNAREYGYVCAARNYTKNEKLNIPYNKVAKQALMNWNGLSEEEAEKIILDSTFDEIESQVYAKSSMDSAISKISQISEIDDSLISNMVFKGHKELRSIEGARYTNAQIDNDSKIDFIRTNFHGNSENKIIDILSAVHNGWVKDNSKKFFTREKKHQHMPIELIGWKEAKADLLFVKPILEALRIKVSEEELEQAYNQRVKNFILDNNIKTDDDLANLISKGADFYPALEGQEDIIKGLSNTDFVKETVIPQIEENGIGKVKDVRQKILESQIKNGVVDVVLDKFTEEELEEMEGKLDYEIANLNAEYEMLTRKRRLIERFEGKINERNEMRKTVEELKSKQADFDYE